MKLHPRSGQAGFTMIEFLVVASAIVILTTLGIAGLNGQRAHAAAMGCGNNLRLIQEAKRAALEDDPTITTFDQATLCQYLPNNQMPVCPGGGTYNQTGSVGSVASCSLDLGQSGEHNVLIPGQTAPAPIKHPFPIRPTGPVVTDPIEIEPD